MAIVTNYVKVMDLAKKWRLESDANEHSTGSVILEQTRIQISEREHQKVIQLIAAYFEPIADEKLYFSEPPHS